MKNTNILYLIALLSSLLFAKPEPYDKILAVVDGEIILYSDLMDVVYQMRNYPSFKGLPSREIEQTLLLQLIDDKILLAQARTDTLNATDEELNARVNEHLERLSQSQGLTQEALAQAVRSQMGISLKEFREQLKERFREDIAKQKIRGRYVGASTPTPGEVQEFYEGYKDSLPAEFNSYRLSHLQIKIKVDQAHLDSIKTLADSVAAKLGRGESFEALAEKYSDDEATKYYGGDLGFITKGALDPLFERQAFKMEQGQFTDVPVKTHLGFHLIKILAKKDNEIRVAQILFNVVPTAEDTIRWRMLADSLQKNASKENFVNLAQKYSEDKLTKDKGGDLGWFASAELNEKYRDVVEKMNKGDVSAVVDIDGDFHIFYLADYEAERRLNLEEDWVKIQEYTQSYAANEKLQELLKGWRKNYYIEIRDPDFKAP